MRGEFSFVFRLRLWNLHLLLENGAKDFSRIRTAIQKTQISISSVIFINWTCSSSTRYMAGCGAGCTGLFLNFTFSYMLWLCYAVVAQQCHVLGSYNEIHVSLILVGVASQSPSKNQVHDSSSESSWSSLHSYDATSTQILATVNGNFRIFLQHAFWRGKFCSRV